VNVGVLLTDFYELTMLQSYFVEKMEEAAVFEFSVRHLPRTRNFLMSAGLEQVLSFLENFYFAPDELAWLAETGKFRNDFIEYLARLRFTGDVHAIPEGDLFFQDEPVLRVTAPLPQAQIVETRIVNLLQFQILIASKAARCVLAAPNKTLVDFGLRRAHGAEAGLFAARASYIAGFAGTSTVKAGQLWNIPLYGTMAHSFVEAHDNESVAFENFVRANPENKVFLLDTYDTERAAELLPALKKKGVDISAVRLDSGDLAKHARKVRKILDDSGLQKVKIIASGGLDEFALEKIINSNAPIDSFGIGTRLDTSADAPQLDCAYKIVEYAGTPRRKTSEGKATLPGRKQIYRKLSSDGKFGGDIVTLENCETKTGTPILQPVMRHGRRSSTALPLSKIRANAADELNRLPQNLRAIEKASTPYEVKISSELQSLSDAL
jgi:nicotinate phosphoribosyltransferase